LWNPVPRDELQEMVRNGKFPESVMRGGELAWHVADLRRWADCFARETCGKVVA